MTATRLQPTATPFPLLEDIVVMADAVIRAHRAPAKIVPALAASLRGALTAFGALPPELLRADENGYSRRELYRSPEHDYQIIAITWAPGQNSGVHDHADTWGVEAILRGQLDVSDYRVVDRHRALSRLRLSNHHTLREGDVISLLPPHHLHACHNASAREMAVSLHIYGTPLENVHRYTHVEDDFYRPERVRLTSV